jgi:predicted PurR-regulated permease PerM
LLEHYFPRLTERNWRWVRFGGLLAALALVCWVAYILRPVFTPLLAALAIAYIVNPLVTWVERHYRVRRLTIVIVAFALLGAGLIGGGFFATSRALAEVAQLRDNIPGYVETLDAWARRLQTAPTLPRAASERPPGDLTSAAPASAPATRPLLPPREDWWRMAAPLLKNYGVDTARELIEAIQTGIFSFANLLSLLVLIPLYTFFFLWRFNDITAALRAHLPYRQRDQVVHVVTTIDTAMADFFRGRLIVCLAVGVLTGIGWSLVGVPYSLPLGALTGILNLVPFLAILALPPALIFTFLGASQSGEPWALPVSLVVVVYLAVQGVDSFVLGPYILGKSSGLHPLAIVVALLIGGQLAGLLGLLLAIPIASTLRTFAAEWLLPEIRRLAQEPVPPSGDPPPSPPLQDTPHD